MFDDELLSDDEIAADPLPSAFKDTIDDYLEKLPVPIETLRQEGLLGSWNNQQRLMPRVAKFALGVLSAPGESFYLLNLLLVLTIPGLPL